MRASQPSEADARRHARGPAHAGRPRPSRRTILLVLLVASAACSGIPPDAAARLATEGEAASARLLTDAAAARRRLDGARDLVLLRAALAGGAERTSGALRARPDIAAAEARLLRADAVLAGAEKALEGLRDAYRTFGQVADGRAPEAFDAALDRAAEDAEAFRTVVERFAADGAEIVEDLPAGGAVLGVARFAGGLVARAATARRIEGPNQALIDVLDGLIAGLDREAEVLGPLLTRIGADRGDDVAAALRRAGLVQTVEAATLAQVAEAFGWGVAPLADQRLRAPGAARPRLALGAVAAGRAAPDPAWLMDPGAVRAVLVALRERHEGLRDGRRADPAILRESLRRLAQ